MWFTCKIKYDKVMEDGLIKKTQESYLVDALSFTEAEKRFVEEMEPFMSGEFEVTDIKKTRITELFESNDSLADKWYNAKVAFITLDEKSGAEKRTVATMYVQAIDLPNALSNLTAGMQGTLGDYTVVSLAETPIMDIYRADLSSKEPKSEEEKIAEQK